MAQLQQVNMKQHINASKEKNIIRSSDIPLKYKLQLVRILMCFVWMPKCEHPSVGRPHLSKSPHWWENRLKIIIVETVGIKAYRLVDWEEIQ